MIPVFLKLLRPCVCVWVRVCDLTHALYQRTFHGCLLLDGIPYICLFGSFSPKCSLNSVFPYWFSVWVFYLSVKVGYWNPLLLLHCCLFLPSNLLILILFTNLFPLEDWELPWRRNNVSFLYKGLAHGTMQGIVNTPE